MQLSKEEYARKRIHNGYRCTLKIPSLGFTVRHHSASLVMPNSYPRGGIFNQHLIIIKDSYGLQDGRFPCIQSRSLNPPFGTDIYKLCFAPPASVLSPVEGSVTDFTSLALRFRDWSW